MEPRVGGLEREVDGLVVHRLDAFRPGSRTAPLQVIPGVSIWVCDGEDDVVGGELLTVAPVDVVAQVHRHLGEVVVVFGWAGRQRVVSHAVDSGVGVDEPERVHHQLMQAGRPSATAIDPDVEPAGIVDGALGVLKYQRLLARQVGDRNSPAPEDGLADDRAAPANSRTEQHAGAGHRGGGEEAAAAPPRRSLPAASRPHRRPMSRNQVSSSCA